MLLINLRSFCDVPPTAAMQVWELATGHEDVYIHSSMIKKWDICAGAAILNSLGGRLTDADGKDIDFKNKWEKLYLHIKISTYLSSIDVGGSTSTRAGWSRPSTTRRATWRPSSTSPPWRTERDTIVTCHMTTWHRYVTTWQLHGSTSAF